MKTFLLQSLFILFFSTGMFFSATHMVVAQTPAPAAPVTPTSLGATREATVNPASVAQPRTGFWSFIGSNIYDALIFMVKWIALSLLSLFAWLLAIAGGLLNLAISYLVIGMGDLVRTGGFGAPIDTMWKIFRGLVNISFVFALIYIGITTIINSGASGAKKLLGAVIISALLVNFSLFFAKATIDVSNIVADNIYRKILSTPQQIGQVSSVGISGLFMEKMGILPLLLNKETSATQARLKSSMDKDSGVSFTILYSIGGGILMFVLAYAFAFGAFLLIIRFVMLILLMIFSPIAFLPDVLPGFGEYRKKWWSTLLSQAFFAPVYLFGLYLSLYILSSSPVNMGDEGLAGLFTAGAASGSIQILLYYAIAIILIIGTTALAKSMSASAGSFAVKATDYVGGKLKAGLKVPFLAPARLAGKAITKPAAYLAREGIKIGGRRILPGVGTAASWAGKWNDKAQGSRTGRNIKRVVSSVTLGALDERARRAVVKTGKTAKIGSYSYQDERDFEKELSRTESGEKRKRERNAAIKLSKDTPGDIDLRNKAQKLIQDMTLVELEEEELTALKEIAGLLSNKQADQIKDHKEKWDDGQKATIKEARKKDQFERFGVNANGVTLNGSGAATFFTGMKPEEVSKLPKEIILDPSSIPYLTGEMLKKIQSAEAITDAEAVALSLMLKATRFIGLTVQDSAIKYLATNPAVSFYG